MSKALSRKLHCDADPLAAMQSKALIEMDAADLNLSCGELLDLRKKRQHQKMLDQALMKDKKKQFSPVDVTMTVLDLDYIDAVDGSFLIKFKLHATYVFDENQRKKEEGADEPKERAPSVGSADHADEVRVHEMGAEDRERLLREEQDKKRVDRAEWANPSNIFNKLYFEARKGGDASKKAVKKTPVHVNMRDIDTSYVSYNLTEEEVALFKQHYEVPVIQVTNFKLAKGETAPDFDEENRMALYHVGPRPNKEGVGGVLNVMWTRDYELTCKEMFELHNFPFDLQELTTDLALADGSPFSMQVNDVRFWKTALNSNEWDPCQPVIKWKTPHSTNATCRVARNYEYYVQNVCGTMTMLTYLGLISFAAQIDDIGTRISNLFTLILTAVAFKLVLGSELPRTSYNTLLDIFVSGCTWILAIMCVGAIIPDQVSGYSFGSEDALKVASNVNRALLYAFAGLITLFALSWWVYSKRKVRASAPSDCAMIKFDPAAANDFTYFFDVQYSNSYVLKDGSLVRDEPADKKFSSFFKEGKCVEREKLSIKTEISSTVTRTESIGPKPVA